MVERVKGVMELGRSSWDCREDRHGRAGKLQADGQFSRKPVFQYRSLRSMGILNENLSGCDKGFFVYVGQESKFYLIVF